jgi:gamma-glutamyltranspeptidase/glutathione hydrolase
MVQGAGFLLNNELDDFSILAGTPNMFGLVGSEANQLRPGRRPLSSMTPSVVREAGGRVVLVLGAPGGPRIISSVLQVVLRVLVYRQDLNSAIAAPRLHQQWRPLETRVEKTFDPGLLGTLAENHGQPFAPGSAAGLVQAIWVEEDGQPTAESDPRSGGSGGIQAPKLPR